MENKKGNSKVLDIVLCIIYGVISFGYLIAILAVLAQGHKLPPTIGGIGILVMVTMFYFVKTLIKLIKNKYNK